MGCILYDNTNDASRRLRNSIIMYKKKPIYVATVDGPSGITSARNIALHVSLLPYTGRGTFVVMLDDPDLCIHGMTLGYINYGNAVYYRRQPNRNNVQGLSSDNLVGEPLMDSLDVPSFTSLITGTEFSNMMENKYPTIAEIEALFKANERINKSQAFDRVLAIENDVFRGDQIVYYKNQKIGFGRVLTGSGLILHKDYRHLREQLLEKNIRVAA
jgi:hypothetical protein